MMAQWMILGMRSMLRVDARIAVAVRRSPREVAEAGIAEAGLELGRRERNGISDLSGA